MNDAITDWRGRRVWIIGASSGIGAALVRRLHAAGALLALSARGSDALHQLAQDWSEVLVLPLDVSAPEACNGPLANILARWGGVDVVFFLAGTYKPVHAWQLDAEEAQASIATNLTGVIAGVAALMPTILDQGSGALVLVSSVAGYRGLPKSLVYGASKAGLINFAETLYQDLHGKGISVFLVNPGFVATPMTQQNDFHMPALIDADDAAKRILDGMARGRFEIHFPKRFTLWLKLLRLLPYRWYFAIVRRVMRGRP